MVNGMVIDRKFNGLSRNISETFQRDMYKNGINSFDFYFQ